MTRRHHPMHRYAVPFHQSGTRIWKQRFGGPAGWSAGSLLALMLLSACGGKSANPNGPTPTPQPSTFTLTGGISETAPTTANKIPGATIAFIDGSNAGKSAIADGAGNYVIAGLQSGGFNVRVTASGYQDIERPVTINADTVLNVALNPNPQTVTIARSDTVSGGDPPCSDGTFLKGCKTVAFPVHNSGIITATLTWDNSSDLDLTLWRNGSLIAESKDATHRSETVSTTTTGGAMYELRVTYYNGSQITNFQLRGSAPN